MIGVRFAVANPPARRNAGEPDVVHSELPGSLSL
jgi:hypothetical protein